MASQTSQQRPAGALPHLAAIAELSRGDSQGSPRPGKDGAAMTYEDRNKARRLLRLADPQARLAFLELHPFFKDTSPLLRERLAPQLVRCSNSQNNAREMVLEQGAEPDSTRGMDYLFLTPPDVHTQVEVMFEGKAITTLGGNAIFAQEVIFGVTRRFVFGTRIATGSLSTLWVVPKSVVQALLSRTAHREDARLLKQRAHNTIVQIFAGWFHLQTTNLPIRLFAATEHAFKRALAEEVEIQIVPAGAQICKELDAQDWAFCVWKGEAQVMQDSSKTSFQRLTHSEGSSAWAAWWGLLQLLEVDMFCNLSVYAETDCVLWRLTPDGFRALKKQFPQECRLFQKVAMEHVRMLQPTAVPIRQMKHFKDCSSAVLRELESADLQRQVVAPGTVIIEQGEANIQQELFFIARGRVSVKHVVAAGGKKHSSSTSPQVTLHAGDFFGEAAAFKVRGVRSSTLVAETICDLLSINGDAICQIMARYQEDSSHIVDTLEARGVGMKPMDDLRVMTFFQSFSTTFLERLLPLGKRHGFLPGFDILREGEPVEHLHVLFQGDVQIKWSNNTQRSRQEVRMKAPSIYASHVFITRFDESSCTNPYTVTSKHFCGIMKFKADEVLDLADACGEGREMLEELVNDEKTELKAARMSTMLHRHSLLHFQELEGQLEEAAEIDEEEERVIGELLEKNFENSDPAFILAVQEVLGKKIYEDGEVILQQGADGDYAILMGAGSSGTVEVNSTKVGEVKAGSFVGETLLLGKSMKRTATVRAVGQVTAYTLSEAAMKMIFEDFPKEKERMINLAELRASTNKALAGSGEESKGKGTLRKVKKKVSMMSAVAAATKKKKDEKASQARGTLAPGSEGAAAAAAKARGTTFSLKLQLDDDDEEDEQPCRSPSGSSYPRKTDARGLFKSGVAGVLAGIRKKSVAVRTTSGSEESVRPDKVRSEASRTVSGVSDTASDSPALSNVSSCASPEGEHAQEGKGRLGQRGSLDTLSEDLAASGNGSMGRRLREDRTKLAMQGKLASWEGSAQDGGSFDEEQYNQYLTPLEIAALFKGEGLVLHRNFLGSSVTPKAWAKRRTQDIRYAQIRQEANQVFTGRFTPLLPPGQSYTSPENSRPGTVQSSKEQKLPRTRDDSDEKHRTATQATKLLLGQAQKLYGKPVWHESW